jgi:hypothetical protein
MYVENTAKFLVLIVCCSFAVAQNHGDEAGKNKNKICGL